MSNVVLDPGVGGATLGTDQVAGIDYQKVKVTFSTDGTAPTSVSASAPLPVVQTGALPAGSATIGGVTQATSPWVCNLTQLGGNAVKTGSGAGSAGSLSVYIATDQPQLSNAQPVLQSGSWTVTANAGTGTFAISAVSLPLPTGAAADSSVNGLLIAQAATGTGAKGPLSQGLVATAAPTYTTGNVNPLSLDTAGNLRVLVANGIASGTAGSPNAAVLTVQGIASMTPVQTQAALTTTGGAAYSNAIAPATPAVTTVKSSAGNLYGVVAFNLLATPVYLKVFDAASVTLGTTSASFQFMIPGNTGGAGFVIQLPVPRSLANALKYAVTGGISLTDNTSITANSVIVDIAYN